MFNLETTEKGLTQVFWTKKHPFFVKKKPIGWQENPPLMDNAIFYYFP